MARRVGHTTGAFPSWPSQKGTCWKWNRSRTDRPGTVALDQQEINSVSRLVFPARPGRAVVGTALVCRPSLNTRGGQSSLQSTLKGRRGVEAGSPHWTKGTFHASSKP